MKNGTILFFVALLGISTTPTAFAGEEFDALKATLNSLSNLYPEALGAIEKKEDPEPIFELVKRQKILQDVVEKISDSPEGLKALVTATQEFTTWLQEKMKTMNNRSIVYCVFNKKEPELSNYLQECSKYRDNLLQYSNTFPNLFFLASKRLQEAKENWDKETKENWKLSDPKYDRETYKKAQDACKKARDAYKEAQYDRDILLSNASTKLESKEFRDVVLQIYKDPNASTKLESKEFRDVVMQVYKDPISTTWEKRQLEDMATRLYKEKKLSNEKKSIEEHLLILLKEREELEARPDHFISKNTKHSDELAQLNNRLTQLLNHAESRFGKYTSNRMSCEAQSRLQEGKSESASISRKKFSQNLQ